MLHQSLKISARAFRWALFGFVSILTVFVLLAAVLLVRIASSPLEIGFARAYIESTLYDPDTGNHATMEQVFLYWPDFKDAIHLVLKGGKILNKDGATLLSVNEVSLTLSKTGLAGGRVMPKTIIVRQPQLRITRHADGKVDIGFGGGGEVGPEPAGQKEEIARILEALSQPDKNVRTGHPLSRLRLLKIEGARLMVEDHIIGLSWFLPDFDAALRRTSEGLKADMTIDLPDVRGKPSRFGLLLNYDRAQKDFDVLVDILNLDAMVLAGKLPSLDVLRDQDLVVNAVLHTSFGQDFQPKHVILKAYSEAGILYHPEVTRKPLPYKGLSLGAVYVNSTGKFELRDTYVTLNGVTIKAQADLVNNQFQSITGPLSIRVDHVEHAQLDPLWPEFLRGDNSELWILQRMSKGTFRDVWATAELRATKQGAAPPPDAVQPPAPGEAPPEALPVQDDVQPPAPSGLAEGEEESAPGWAFDVDNVQAGYAFENLSVDYRAPLFPVTNSKGTGHFDLKTDILGVKVESGKLGALDLLGGEIVLGEVVAEGKGSADISVKLKGGLRDAFAYLSEDPINLQKNKKIDLKQVKGEADLDVRMIFDTSKPVMMDEMDVRATGTLKDIVIPDVLRTLDLSGGPFALTLEDKKVALKGKGQLHSRDIDLNWEEFMVSKGKPYKSKVTAKIAADPNLRQELGIVLDTFLEGSVPLEITYTTHSDGKAVADVNADAKGARFFIDPFDYEKPVGEEGSARFKAHFKDEQITEITGLTAKTARFTLDESQLTFKGKGAETYLSGGKTKRFQLDETDAGLDFTMDEKGQVKILFDGAFLDMRPFMDAEPPKAEGYTDPPSVVSVSAKTLRTSDKQTVSDGKLYIDIDAEGRFNQFEMDAKVGKGDIYLRFKPDREGKKKFFLEATDAGATLKAFNVYNGMKGGTMTVSGEPVKGVYDRNFSGTVEIRDFTANDAPSLTKLFSILSLSGLMEVLQNDGLAFTRLEAKFNWVYRREGALLVLKDGRTSGNTLGLTFDGEFDNARQTLDVSGTLIPLSGINKVIGKIPLVGDIITGGSGSLFAATYSIKGKMADPVISANPLSVLAPGLLRRILFE